jgi:hypothetical protein
MYRRIARATDSELERVDNHMPGMTPLPTSKDAVGTPMSTLPPPRVRFADIVVMVPTAKESVE